MSGDVQRIEQKPLAPVSAVSQNSVPVSHFCCWAGARPAEPRKHIWKRQSYHSVACLCARLHVCTQAQHNVQARMGEFASLHCPANKGKWVGERAFLCGGQRTWDGGGRVMSHVKVLFRVVLR